MQDQTGRWFKRQTLVLVCQTIVLMALVIFTVLYVNQTGNLAEQTARLAKTTEQQTELILGINRPHVELMLVDVEYEYLFAPGLELPGLEFATNVQVPVAMTISVVNKGNQSALGGEVYILGQSFQEEERPLGSSLWSYLSVPPSRSYWYWSETEEFEELPPGEKMEYILHRNKVGDLTELIFPYTEIKEQDMKYASEVPFAFAVVAICEDDFGRAWLSARELKIDCETADCRVIEGRLRVFVVKSEG